MTIYLLTQSYLNENGTCEIYSGLQRYVRELTHLLVSCGLQCTIVQKAAQPFVREVAEGVRVIGLAAKPRFSADPYFN